MTLRRPKPIVTQSKAAVREGQVLGIRNHERDLRRQAAVDQAVAAAREHLAVDVGEYREAVLAHLAREAGAEVAGAGGHVERAMARPEPGLPEGEALPEPV